MLFLLSPAKALNYESPVLEGLAHSVPMFKKQAQELIEIMREKTPADLASLMGISDNLAVLNAARFEAWSPTFTAENSKQAILAFDGDVYDGMDAKSLNEAELLWAQDHLLILSGLYGVLRPLDWMQAYRLEMGTKQPNAKGKDLYAYWKDVITPELNRRLDEQKQAVVVSLASNEYFKSVDVKALKARVVECIFEDYFEKTGKYRIITLYSKRARGMMMRYAIQNKVDTPEKLKGFDLGGYAFSEGASEENRFVFRRRLHK